MIVIRKSKSCSCFIFLLFTVCFVFFVQLLFYLETYIAGSHSTFVVPQRNEQNLALLTSSLTGYQHGQILSNEVRIAEPDRHLPKCIIIGFPKCGTGALIECLCFHPMIRCAREDVHFFDNDTTYSLGLDWYRRRMPNSSMGQITIEKTPTYFMSPSAPERIRLMDPKTKLLLVVKDPVTRLIADYAQIATINEEKGMCIPSFEESVLENDCETVNKAYEPVRISVYAMFFRIWLSYFPREQIHIVDGDRLILDPLAEVRNVEMFLGLPNKINSSNFHYNKTKGFFCFGKDTMEDKCLGETKDQKYLEVSSEIVSLLRMFYGPYNKSFYLLTGLNFSWPIY